MQEVSVVWLDADNPMIKPLTEKLGEHLCAVYSKKARNNAFKNDGESRRIVSSYLPGVVRILVDFLSRIKIVPQYYSYMLQHRAMDMVYANRVANDKSIIVYAHGSYIKTIRKAKKKGKVIVVMAGNSEPIREYNRVMNEYNKYGIRHRYIYGNIKYQTRIKENMATADHVISISKVSEETYRQAGYDMTRFHLIPLTGTDFPVQKTALSSGKPKVFITTAFHNFIKGTHRLLLAWKKANIKSIPLIVTGRLCEDMQEFVSKYGPFENVHFMGFVKGSLADFYKQYDAVGVLLSLSEGAVRTTPELMSFGFPVIVSPDATCDIVEDGKNGFIIDPEDEDAVVAKLRWFAEDWERGHTMKSSVITSVCHRTVRDFSLECADYIMDMIKEDK